MKTPHLTPSVNAEVESACWLNPDQIVLSRDPEEEPLRNGGSALGPGELGIWSLAEGQWVARNPLGGHTGTLHAIGGQVLALYEHPRLIEPTTGAVMDAWPDIATGTQTSSILLGQQLAPPVAVDPANSRFAVAADDTVTIIQLPPAAA